MSDMNTDISTADSTVVLSEILSAPVISSSSSPSTTVDDETKRRRILSKLWGKGNKSSHKVRELEKSTTNTSSDSSTPNDHDQQQQFNDHLSSYSSANDPKSIAEDNSNSINSKPLAVVKPIVLAKSGLTTSSASDRSRVNSETSSVMITQTDEATVSTIERTSSTTTTVATDEKSSKKKKSHKHESSKKKKTSRDKSHERDRHHDHHQTDDKSNKKSSSSSKNHRREQNEENSANDQQKSSHHSSSTSSSSNNKRKSSSNEIDHSEQKSHRSTTSKKDKPSSSKRSTLSPVDRHHHRRDSRSPSPSRSRHSNTHRDRSETKHSSSPKRSDRSSTTTMSKSNRRQTESVVNSKSTNSNSPTDSHVNQPHKTRTSDENLTVTMKTQKSHESSPPQSSSSSNKQEKSKVKTTDHEENSSHRRKLSSSQHDRRSSSRHRSRSKEDKGNRKTTENSIVEERTTSKNKTNRDTESTTAHDNSNHEKKSSRGSPIPSSSGKSRRRSSPDHHHHHHYDRHDSSSEYDRRNVDYYYRHRHSNTHYVHHHHHHHYRSTSSRYHHHRRSPSPRSYHRSRYFSSTSSSFSSSPRRRSPSRSPSSSSSRSSSYSTISRTSSSSRSSSRNHYYYSRHRHENNFRRSPTLEKLFLKASESIESVSTQKNPNQPSSSSSATTTHLIPVQTSSTTSELQVTSPMNSLSETQAYYPERFLGFSAPPPPFMAQPPQRYLKEITTDSSALRRPMFNELLPSIPDETTSIKPIQTNELSTSVRSGTSKPARVSRFSDIIPNVPSESPLNTNLPVDTLLNYTQVSENINCLPSSRRQQKRHNREVMECECTTSEYDRSRGIKACGPECLNRILLIECSSNCPCGQWCTNRRFQRRSYATHKLALFKTEMKGHGLRTTSSIRKGRFLVEYVGEVIDMDELARRSKKYKRDGNIHQYVMSLIHGTVIDSTIKGNWARFINHSCEPNCVAEKWLVNGEYRMGIFAKRDLEANEEITIDYRFETFGSTDLANEKCYCGAPTCRGTISIKSNNNNNNNNHSNKRQTRRKTIDDDELLDYLHDDETNEYIIPKTIDEIRHLIQIMSRTDSENVRSVELDLIRTHAQKHPDLPRLFLECNGLRVLCSWMKDILIDDQEQQQYSQEFQYHLLDFIHTILPIKDRTIVIKNGLLDLVRQKLRLPPPTTTTTQDIENTEQEQIQDLMNSMLNHLDNPIITKLFYIYSTWMSLKERYIIPKRKESVQTPDHHHHHHHHRHHHSSKHSYDENDYRLNFNTRSSMTQPKSGERYSSRRSFVVVRDSPRTQEEQLSRDERRKLFEQQYEDEEKARAAAAAAINGESPGGQNEPPHKKQRTSNGTDPTLSNISPETQTPSMSYQQQMDQTFTIHRHLSQIPIDYIRSYLISIGQPMPGSSTSTDKVEPPVPPPVRPDDEMEVSRIIRLPSGWSVAMCPSDSSVYFYNAETMKSSWLPPILEIPTENSGAPLDLSPVSFAQITEQRRPHHHHHQSSSSSRTISKLLKHSHRHSRNDRHHHHHHHPMANHSKRKRPIETESTTMIKEEPTEDATIVDTNEQIKEENIDENYPTESIVPKGSFDADNDIDMPTISKEPSESTDHVDDYAISSENKSLSLSIKQNRDPLRKNISQHVHMILKPYTKRTCKQGRIASTDDIKYLVKKFTLAVLDKEIEKAKNEGSALPPVSTERVRLKTEMYVKKYMNKMGPVFQRHETVGHASSQSSQQQQQPTTTTSISE